MERVEWLSAGAEQLAGELERTRQDGTHCDIAIVGSGYGGAVAAARLAGATETNRATSRVWVLERGREFVPGTFPERFADLPGEMRVKLGADSGAARQSGGLFDLRIGKDVSALLGNGLGGGSLINAGVLARPDAAVLEGWPLPAQALEPGYAAAEDMLGAARVPPPAPAKLLAIEAVGRRLDGGNADRRASVAVSFSDGAGGNRENPWGVPQRACIRCGDCFAGCNHWAKNTLAMNYLPLAYRRGAELFTGVTVLSLKPSNVRVAGEPCWELTLRFTDRQVERRFGSELKSLIARRVILAAGTYGSTGILLRSAKQGLLVSKRIGERFSANGDMIAIGSPMPQRVYASARETVEPSKRNIGPTITGMIDLRRGRARADQLVIEELAIPAILRRLFEEVVTNFGALHRLLDIDWKCHTGEPTGSDPAAINQDTVERTAVYATMGDDGAGGAIKLTDDGAALRSDDGVCVDWQNVGATPIFRRAVEVLEQGHQGTGAKVIPNPMWSLLPKRLQSMLQDGPLSGSVFTAHPLGGCAMAVDAEHGVVNRFGQVFRQADGRSVYGTLAVLDGSIVPGALGVNPCLTIAALAEHASAELARAWHLKRPESPCAGDPWRPLPRLPKRAADSLAHPLKPAPARVPTAFRLAERLKGDKLRWPVELGGRLLTRKLDATLQVEYREIADLQAFVVTQPKIMTLAKGSSLELRGRLECGDRRNPRTIDVQARVRVEGQLRLFVRARSTALGRICRALWAWLRNRGMREIWLALLKLLSPRSEGFGLSLLRELIAVASHAGEVRQLEYEITVTDDVVVGKDMKGKPIRVLAKGDRLTGMKRVAYMCGSRPRSNPWTQFMRLPLSLARQSGGCAREVGEFVVDLPYFVTQFATQLQLLHQANQADAIADLLSTFTYIARLVGKIHIWTFRLPEYPDPYPRYARDSAEGRRLPGDLSGYQRKVYPERPVIQGRARFRLTRYVAEGDSEKARKARKPVLLIHGFGASGTTFTLDTVDKNLVQFLGESHFDPWVLDLRTSIGLPSSNQDWTFEEVAFKDIPAAIRLLRQVRKKGGDDDIPLSVVAHCIGAAMFCMATLAGKLRRGWVRAAVLSQVGPLIELPPQNRFRGYVASYIKEYLKVENFNVTAELTPGNQFIDRLLAAYPYPEREWVAHHPACFLEGVPHEAYCNRASAIYGRLFEHVNLNEATLNGLGELIGHVRYRTYQQTIFYALQRRLTDCFGKNLYVKWEKIHAYLNFPVCFVHGKKNDVFHYNTSRRSFDLLASIFWDNDLKAVWEAAAAEQEEYATYGNRKYWDKLRRLRLLEIEGYGHQDCLIGRDAHRDVFPGIADFLVNAPDGSPEIEPEECVVRPVRIGPIVGWLRRRDKKPVVRLFFQPNDLRSDPLYAMTIVLRNGMPAADFADFSRFHRLRELKDPFAPHPLPAVQSGPPTQAVDVTLPDDACDYQIALLTVHREVYEPEPKRDRGDPRADDPFGEDYDRYPETRSEFPGKNAVPADAREFADPVLRTCKDFLGGIWLDAGKRVCDPRYATPVSVAFVTKRALQASGAESNSLCFAFGSCRYAAAVNDRELADRSFGRLRARIMQPKNDAAVPQLLLLVGDQIYADATAGLFDPTQGIERYDQRYHEVWSAPNAREVLRRLPVYPMLDDHEVEENWDGTDDPQAASKTGNIETGRRAFVSYQQLLTPNITDPTRVNLEARCYWYCISDRAFEFFVADTRSERHEPKGRIMLDEQMRALKRWLKMQHAKDSSAPKFVVSPSVVAPWSRETRGHACYKLRSDAWDGFPESLHELLGFIAEEEIRNVVFLSGDYHMSTFCKMKLQSANKRAVKAYSIVSSGFYAPYPFANTTPDSLALNYKGTHAEWLGDGTAGCCGLAELRIKYKCEGTATRDGFAVVDVTPHAQGGWEMSVEFDTEDGVPPQVVRLQ